VEIVAETSQVKRGYKETRAKIVHVNISIGKKLKRETSLGEIIYNQYNL